MTLITLMSRMPAVDAATAAFSACASARLLFLLAKLYKIAFPRLLCISCHLCTTTAFPHPQAGLALGDPDFTSTEFTVSEYSALHSK